MTLRTCFKTVIFILVIAGCSKTVSAKEAFLELQLKSLLPPRDSVPGITISREPEFFLPANLSSYQKENADLIVEYGLDLLLVAEYFKSGEIITVEIFKMSNPWGAYGFFTTCKIPKEGELKIGDGSIRSKSSIVFWQEDYAVKIISLGRAEGTDKAVESIARIVSSRIAVHGKISYLTKVFPEKGMVPDSVRLIMGPVGLKKYFYFVPDAVLDDRANIHDGSVANYKDEKGNEFVVAVLRYDSVFEAGKILPKIVDALNRNSVDHHYIFNILSYKMNDLFFRADKVSNYIILLRYKTQDLKYDWYLDRIKERITVKGR